MVKRNKAKAAKKDLSAHNPGFNVTKSDVIP